MKILVYKGKWSTHILVVAKYHMPATFDILFVCEQWHTHTWTYSVGTSLPLEIFVVKETFFHPTSYSWQISCNSRYRVRVMGREGGSEREHKEREKRSREEGLEGKEGWDEHEWGMVGTEGGKRVEQEQEGQLTWQWDHGEMMGSHERMELVGGPALAQWHLDSEMSWPSLSWIQRENKIFPVLLLTTTSGKLLGPPTHSKPDHKSRTIGHNH